MSETDNNNGLPPKLNLSKKIAKPTAKPGINLTGANKPEPLSGKKPAPLSGSETAPPSTSRIQLTSKPNPQKPISGITKPASPAEKQPATKAAQPTSAPTVRLKARPKAKPVLTSSAEPTITAAAPTAATATQAPTAKPQLAPKSVKLNSKPAVGIKRSAIDPAAPAGSKRATSKIPLSEVSALGSSINTKTIKIKPTADVKTLSGKLPITLDPQEKAAPIPDPKRQTSRISLDAVLGTEEMSQNENTGPKTIRLKRPGKTPTVNLESTDDEKTLSKTSKIELPDESQIPSTQKKTIKVKRPSQRPTAKKLSVKRAGEETPEAGEGTANSGIPIAPLSSLAPTQAPDTVHWTFIVSSVAATIIIGVFIYVMCSQVFGPNISLTQLSYGAPSVDLPWPGRISINQ